MKITVTQPGVEKVYICNAPDLVIGRAAKGSDVEVQIDIDPSISRRHLRAWIDEGKLWVEDLGSAWGTRVNGVTIDKPTCLAAGDRLHIGDSILTISLGVPADKGGAAEDGTALDETVLPGFLRKAE